MARMAENPYKAPAPVEDELVHSEWEPPADNPFSAVVMIAVVLVTLTLWILLSP